MMNSTRRTVILTTAAIDVPLLSYQTVAGEFIHGGVGGKKSLNYSVYGRGLTTTFEETSNKIDPINSEEEQLGGGGSSRYAEAEDKEKEEDDYYYPNEDAGAKYTYKDDY